MTPAGQATIDLAKEKGTWLAPDQANPAQLPHDLTLLLEHNKTAYENYQAFSPSAR